MKIVEVIGGTTNSTKQFIWCGNDRCEARDGSSALTAQYFSRGETISGTSYYWTKDHLGSMREMSNAAGTIVWQQSFDPYGIPTSIVGTTAADFGYAGYYLHSRSGLNLTRTRAYNASLGRFVNRDMIQEAGGLNLFAYVLNNPVNDVDPLGLCPPHFYPPDLCQLDPALCVCVDACGRAAPHHMASCLFACMIHQSGREPTHDERVMYSELYRQEIEERFNIHEPPMVP